MRERYKDIECSAPTARLMPAYGVLSCYLPYHGLIQMRNLKDNEVEEYEVSGDHIQGVWMKPGWTHNIINLSETEDLVTVMWASEMLDKNRPDTFFEKV